LWYAVLLFWQDAVVVVPTHLLQRQLQR